jgi:hypothetical protein
MRLPPAVGILIVLVLVVTGCGSIATGSNGPSACPSGEHYVAGRIYPTGTCYPKLPAPVASCPADQRYVAGRMYPIGACFPKGPLPVVSCAPGERKVAGVVNPDGTCYPPR